MTDAARIQLALRTAGNAKAARPLLAALPWFDPGTTRGAYARHVHRVSLATARRLASRTTGDPR